MPFDPNDDTGSRRRATTADDCPDCAWHDRLVEHFGASGTGGDWSRVVKIIERHDVELLSLKELKWKLLGMVTLGGMIAGVLAWLIPQLISGRH